MIIRCYGARGSIPISGKEHLKYGGDTACIEVRTKNGEIIIVDAGSGIRRLGNDLIEEGRSRFTVLFTHSHWDHILGFPFFKPLFNEGTVVELRGCPEAQGNIRKLLSKAMSAPLFPFRLDQMAATIRYDGECPPVFRIDSVEISTIRLSHPNSGIGYRFVEDGKVFVFLTDNELGYRHRGGRPFDEYTAFARHADLLIHDAEYTPEQYKSTIGWGHSTYVDAMTLAMAAGASRLGLFHHNQDRTDAEQDEIVRECHQILEEEKASMECFALSQTMQLFL